MSSLKFSEVTHWWLEHEKPALMNVPSLPTLTTMGKERPRTGILTVGLGPIKLKEWENLCSSSCGLAFCQPFLIGHDHFAHP